MYVSGTTSATDSSTAKDKQQVTAAPIRSRVGMGSMSKRFDGKDETTKQRSSVSNLHLFKPILKITYLARHQRYLRRRWSQMMTKQLLWQPCSKLRLTFGRKHRRRCRSPY